jgi:hypothetical protein
MSVGRDLCRAGPGSSLESFRALRSNADHNLAGPKRGRATASCTIAGSRCPWSLPRSSFPVLMVSPPSDNALAARNEHLGLTLERRSGSVVRCACCGDRGDVCGSPPHGFPHWASFPLGETCGI